MKLVNKIKEQNLSITEDCHLAILNNFNKNSVAYQKSFLFIKELIVIEFNDVDFQFDEIDVNAEIHSLLEVYNQLN
jgi:hypothetical protein